MIFRARVVLEYSNGSCLAVIPQVFGDTQVTITRFLGATFPLTPGMGWVMFEGGNSSYPVWMGYDTVDQLPFPIDALPRPAALQAVGVAFNAVASTNQLVQAFAESASGVGVPYGAGTNNTFSAATTGTATGTGYNATTTSVSTTYPILQSTTQASEVYSTSITITKPSGVAVGDVIVIAVRTVNNGVTTSLSGFTQQVDGSSTDSTDYNNLDIWTRVADGSEASTFSVALSSLTYSAAVAFRVSGSSGTITAAKFDTNAGYTQSRRLPTVTTPSAFNLLIGVHTLFYTTVLGTTPAGWTASVVATKTGGEVMWSFQKNAAAAGATGNTDFDETGVFELPVAGVIALAP